MRRTSQLELVCDPQLSTVVFRYLSTRADSDETNSAIRRRLFDRGQAVVGHTRVGDRQCLKFTCMNPSVSEVQLEDLIGLVVEQGKEFEQEFNRR